MYRYIDVIRIRIHLHLHQHIHIAINMDYFILIVGIYTFIFSQNPGRTPLESFGQVAGWALRMSLAPLLEASRVCDSWLAGSSAMLSSNAKAGLCACSLTFPGTNLQTV